jgi:hypothetical protein
MHRYGVTEGYDQGQRSQQDYYSGQLIVPISYGGVLDMFSVEIFSHDMSLHLALT